MFFEHRFWILDEMLRTVYLSFMTILAIFFLFILKIIVNLYSNFSTKLMAAHASYEIAKAAEKSSENATSSAFLNTDDLKQGSILRSFFCRLAYLFSLVKYCWTVFPRTDASVMLHYVKSTCFLEYKRCVELVSCTRNSNSLEEFFYGFITCFIYIFVFYYMSIYALTRAPNTVSSLWVIFCFFSSGLVWFYKTGRDQHINLLIRVKGSELQSDFLYYKYLIIPIVLSLYFLVFYCIFIDFFFLDVIQQQSTHKLVCSATPGGVLEIKCGNSDTHHSPFLAFVWEFYPDYDSKYFDGTSLKK